MTQQEAWLCDGCLKIHHFPLSNRIQVKIKCYDEEEAEIEWDLCTQCYDKLMDFLQTFRDDNHESK